MTGAADKEIQLGYISGVFGVHGWVKVHSFTSPRENILKHVRWTIVRGREAGKRVDVHEARTQGKTLVAKLDGVDDRDAAASLIGAQIVVARSELPECAPGEYYWADLEGMTVRDRAGNMLGRVARLIETGAHDVLVLDGPEQRMIPFVLGDVVTGVDVQARTVTVAWDAGYWDE